ncbi:HYC_CC_PP family protein [Winogradskyella sp. R77965]|uniref:HYC_CC_PP family protein n=1 Tax=Winogradskyella sp. R77965 TaxID=3093872 RepID=UPI0037DC9F9E
MNVSITHKVFSITLSFLVLFSTLSFTVEKHYCGDNLVDVAVFSEAKKCGGMTSEDVVYVKKSCCKDTVDVFEGQDELNTQDFEDLNKTLQITLVAYAYSYSNLFESLPRPIIPHKDYSPPNLTKDIQVLDETYLI